MNIFINHWLAKHVKLKQWLWFIGLWFAGLLSVVVLSKLIKIFMHI